MRFDRFLTLHLFGAIFSKVRLHNEFRIPILMYHSISDDPENGIPSYYRINTSPRRFAEHMQFLRDNNYEVIDLAEAVKLFSSKSSGFSSVSTFHHSSIPKKRVVLTFDDGYRDFFTFAFSILKTHHFKATVYLPTAFIDGRQSGIKEKKHLNWSEVIELRKEGVDFGSHTVNHLQLMGLKLNEVDYEIRKSKEIIEDKLETSVNSFCYPYKFPATRRAFIERFKDCLVNAGYNNAVSTRVGTVNAVHDVFSLRRLPMNSTDDIALFRSKLEGDYDWFAIPQSFTKILKEKIKSLG